MPEIEVGVVGKVVAGVDGGRSVWVVDGEVGPVVGGGKEVARELCESEAELLSGSAWAEEVWNGGSTVSSSSPAFGWPVAAFWGFGAGNWRGSAGNGLWGFSWC